MSNAKKSQGTWLKVFCPNARCLSDTEVADLPPDKLKAAQNDSKEGLWMEVFCPEGTCETGPQKFWTVEETSSPSGGKGLWLKLFCPEDACEINQASEEP